MNTNTKGQRSAIFTKSISEDEMDRRLDAQHEEVVAMLEEARENFDASEGQSADART